MRDQLGRLLSAGFFSNLIMVVGTGRSGTSVLLQALGHHPQIFDMPGEAPYLTSVGASAFLFDKHPDRAYFMESLKVPKAYLYDQLRRLAFEVAGGPHYAWRRMVKGLLGRGRSPVGRKYWCVKAFPGKESALGLLVLYPSLRIVYIVRNGCDVVHSMSRYEGFSDEDFETHCRRWADGVEKYRYLLAMKQVALVNHESLLADPEAFFARLFSFLGVPQHPGPALFARTTVVHPLDNETQKGVDPRAELRLRRPPWTHWTLQQRRRFEETCGPGMLELGYSLPF